MVPTGVEEEEKEEEWVGGDDRIRISEASSVLRPKLKKGRAAT